MGALLHETVWLLLMVCVFGLATGAPVYDEEQGLVPSTAGDGCYYNFVHYEEGDRILTNEPCLNCTCSNKMLMCYLRVCPFMRAVGQDCTIEKKPDQCCPVVTCPQVPVALLTSTTTTSPSTSTAVGMLDNYGCTLEDNTFYPDGAQVPSHPTRPCELCYCIRNHTACIMQECTLNVDGYKPVYQDGVCCPVRYAFESTEVSTTPRPTPGHVAPNGSQTCFGHNGTLFRDGELMDNFSSNPCKRCYCMSGIVVCAVRDCGAPMEGTDCEPIEPEEGQCCPSSYRCANGIVPAPSLPEKEHHYTSNNEKEENHNIADSSASESIPSVENENVPEGFGTGEKVGGLKPENTDSHDSEPLTPTSDEAAQVIPEGTEEVKPSESTEKVHSLEVTSELPVDTESVHTHTVNKEQEGDVDRESTEHETSPTETPVSHGEMGQDAQKTTTQEEYQENVEGSHVNEEHSTLTPHTESSPLDDKNESPQTLEETSTPGHESSSAETGPTVAPNGEQPEGVLTPQQTKPSDHLTSNEIPESVSLPSEDNSELEPIESARIPGEGSCLVDGKTYAPNSEVPKSNPCHKICHCVNSIVQCEQVKCPPLPPSAVYSNCFPIETPGSCCPTFMCDQKPSDAPEIQNQVSIDKIDMSIDEDGHLSATPQETTSHPPQQGFTESTDQVTVVPGKTDDVPLVHGGESAFHGGSETVSAEENKLSQNGESAAEHVEFEDKTEETHLPENTETGLSDNKNQKEAHTETTQKPVEEETRPVSSEGSESHTEKPESDFGQIHHLDGSSPQVENANHESDFSQTSDSEHEPSDNEKSQPEVTTETHESHQTHPPTTEVEGQEEHSNQASDNTESQPEPETEHQESHPTQPPTNEESQPEPETEHQESHPTPSPTNEESQPEPEAEHHESHPTQPLPHEESQHGHEAGSQETHPTQPLPHEESQHGHEAGSQETHPTQPLTSEESSPESDVESHEEHPNQPADNGESRPHPVTVSHEEQSTQTPTNEESSPQTEVEGHEEHSHLTSDNEESQPEHETESHGEQYIHMHGEDHKLAEEGAPAQSASSEPTTVLNEMEGQEKHTTQSYNKEELQPESERDQTQELQSLGQEEEESNKPHSESSSNEEPQPESEKHTEHTEAPHTSHPEPSLPPSEEESDVTHSTHTHDGEELHPGSSEDSDLNEGPTQQAEMLSNESPHSTQATLTEDHQTESERGNTELPSTQPTFHKESETQSEVGNDEVHPTLVADNEKFPSEPTTVSSEGESQSHTLQPPTYEESHTQTEEVNNVQEPVHEEFQPNSETEVENTEPHLTQHSDSEKSQAEASQESHTTLPTTNEESSPASEEVSHEHHSDHVSDEDKTQPETEEASQESHTTVSTTSEETSPHSEVVSHEQHSDHVSDKEETQPETDEASQESHTPVSTTGEESSPHSEVVSHEQHSDHVSDKEETQPETDEASQESHTTVSTTGEESSPHSEVESHEQHSDHISDKEETQPETDEASQESHTTVSTTSEESSPHSEVVSHEQHSDDVSDKEETQPVTDEASQESHTTVSTTGEESSPHSEVVSHEHSDHVFDKEETQPETGEASQESHTTVSTTSEESSPHPEGESHSQQVHTGEEQPEFEKESEGVHPAQAASEETSTPLSEEESHVASSPPTFSENVDAEHELHPTQSKNENDFNNQVPLEDKHGETASAEPEVSTSEQGFSENHLEHEEHVEHAPEKTTQETDRHDESLTESNVKHNGHVTESVDVEHEVPTTEGLSYSSTESQTHDNAETSHHEEMSSLSPEHPVGEESSSEASFEVPVDVTSEGPTFFDNAHDSNKHDSANEFTPDASTEQNEEHVEQSEVSSPQTPSHEVDASTHSSEQDVHQESPNVVSGVASQSEGHVSSDESSSQEQVTSLPVVDHSESMQTSSETPAFSHSESPENEELESSKQNPTTLAPEHESVSFHNEPSQSKPDESHQESSSHQGEELAETEHTENAPVGGTGEYDQGLPNVEDQAESVHGPHEEQQGVFNLDDLHQPPMNVPEEEMHTPLTEQETPTDVTHEQNVDLHENTDDQSHGNDVNVVSHTESASPHESVDDSETSPSDDKQTVTHVEETKVPEHLPIENQLLESTEPSLDNKFEYNVHMTEAEHVEQPLDNQDSSPVPAEGEAQPEVPKPDSSEPPSENSPESDRAEVHESQNEPDEHKVGVSDSTMPEVPVEEHSQEADNQSETHPVAPEDSEHQKEPSHELGEEVQEHTPEHEVELPHENEEHHEESTPQHEVVLEENKSTLEGQEPSETSTESHEKHPDQQEFTLEVHEEEPSQTEEHVSLSEDQVSPSEEPFSPSEEHVSPSEEHVSPSEEQTVSPVEEHKEEGETSHSEVPTKDHELPVQHEVVSETVKPETTSETDEHPEHSSETPLEHSHEVQTEEPQLQSHHEETTSDVEHDKLEENTHPVEEMQTVEVTGHDTQTEHHVELPVESHQTEGPSTHDEFHSEDGVAPQPEQPVEVEEPVIKPEDHQNEHKETTTQHEENTDQHSVEHHQGEEVPLEHDSLGEGSHTESHVENSTQQPFLLESDDSGPSVGESDKVEVAPDTHSTETSHVTEPSSPPPTVLPSSTEHPHPSEHKPGTHPLFPSWSQKPFEHQTSQPEVPHNQEETHYPSGLEPDYEEEDGTSYGPGTCRYGGKVYLSAQQIPREDPCDFCFCFRSDVICLQQSCPPPIKGCYQETIKGFCCPRYECHVSTATVLNITTTTTTTTTTLPPHFLAHAYNGAAVKQGCQVNGVAYSVGQRIPSTSGPCLECRCGGNGQMDCDPTLCGPQEALLRQVMDAAAVSKRR